MPVTNYSLDSVTDNLHLQHTFDGAHSCYLFGVVDVADVLARQSSGCHALSAFLQNRARKAPSKPGQNRTRKLELVCFRC